MTDLFYALVPAAGFGARMGHELPKQYHTLAGKPMIYHALATLCANPDITTVFVVLAPDDAQWRSYDWTQFGDKLQPLFCGGQTRAESVLNGLLASELEPEDWVLVHDAARPCLSAQQLAGLLAELRDDEVGGLLAVPVADTLKRADAKQRVAHTESREGLWQAQTPQMFRTGLLVQALETARNVTDEASAVEALGLFPKLVSSDSSNFKVTYPQDMQLAELLLQHGNIK
ncbi:MAG: 2-C-methyl-D-erythritol 4-phosphate cytidylyltransferase [Gallionellales bacterium 35-53-114]|jgi:2-C-methyl-D-erythritol 4-phosphate cytidylyltransferase|nr:MAG: 2-C-methyl-D-erythritol 4-phosphate cytidylyltransferase [Gallionellales bacterium 35-53-114]OYZ62763.1 MAG: 2-C-methyl-D-erythritol 4-phosphate cytidylyltransferase [Gallionellales bacterium 24-53-125]OZB09839.1 MAG: 2-C-methyl-D-erythritol 4-phosphate cytidylyltransferase [Gallionellales bacterium 39-52-133]HQS57596.1 2-C-methyl-D-erythritol 4-phosphate cytidylyltransferase [Gallionellaceae bacterium]HQS74050.1 2-C-methyl-D-erythritol 4-phosphate cytidylyltransferase [Gallionellaceae 